MAFALLAAVFAITLPFGVWRVRTHRYSLWWFLSIHVPIPFIFVLRMAAGYSYTFIPLTVSACVAGQLVGGRLGARLRRRHGGGEMQAEVTPAEVPATPAGLITLGDPRSGRHDHGQRVDASG